MSVDLKQFHQVFIEESIEGLDAMESGLMELDPNNPDDELINTIFRSAHSIKGGAGTFGFTTLAEFTHILETLLDEVRSGTRQLAASDIDLFLQSVDCMRELIDMIDEGKDEYTDSARDLKSKFEAVLKGETVENTPAPAVNTTPSAPAEDQEDPKADSEESKIWHIHFKPSEDIIRTGNDPLRLIKELGKLGNMHVRQLSSVPSLLELHPEDCYFSWDIQLESDISEEAIREIFEWVEDDSDIRVERVSASAGAWFIRFLPHEDILSTGNDPYKIIKGLASSGDIRQIKVISDLPSLSTIDPHQCYLGWEIEYHTEDTLDSIKENFEWVEDYAEVDISPLAADLSADQTESPESKPVESELAEPENNASNVVPISEPAKNEVAAPAENTNTPANNANPGKSSIKKKNASGESSSIRVGIDKIDNLINMVGELVITQSMLGQIGDGFDESQTPKLLEGLSQLEQNTRELQESVMKIRMLPISFAFSRFPRMVRDLGKTLGKSVNLEMHGETTELDKTVMEKIGDPLVHLVRNAIDHGIEKPEERIDAGKAETGLITLNAYHQGGNVVIEISDDGRGLDRDKIKAKAIKNGLLTQAEADLMPDNLANELIFHPGLSTAKEISDVSGRGVGMDVVKKNIQALNGVVEITSERGQGSTITVRLPLTLAILDGQLVRVGESTYIFPLVSIVESMMLHHKDKNKVAGGCDVFLLRDEYVPVIDLYKAFSISCDEKETNSSLTVVVESDGDKIGIVVDELLAQQQVVIKSLEDNYQRITGVSGATILGDGTVALILDMPGIVELAGEKLGFENSLAFSKKMEIQRQLRDSA